MVWSDPISAIIVLATKRPTLTQWYAALQTIIDKIDSMAAYVEAATTTSMGLCPVLDGDSTHFLNGNGAFAHVSIAVPFQIRIPASEIAQNVMTPLSMGGDGAEVIKERLDNGFERWFVGFGYTTAQYACDEVPLPDGYNDDSLEIVIEWETDSSTLGTFVMPVYGELIGDNDLSSVALTSPIATVTDTNNGAGRRNVSAATALNPAGSGNSLMLRFTRDFGTDTIEDDIKVVGIYINGTKTVTS